MDLLSLGLVGAVGAKRSSYSQRGMWLSNLMDLLSLGLVGAVGARVNVRRSYSKWWPTVTWI